MKNVLIVILLMITVGAIVFGYAQKANLESCVSAKEALEKIAQEQELRAKEFQKMAELAQQEAVIQRTICEEQLKAFKK